MGLVALFAWLGSTTSVFVWQVFEHRGSAPVQVGSLIELAVLCGVQVVVGLGVVVLLRLLRVRPLGIGFVSLAACLISMPLSGYAGLLTACYRLHDCL